MSRSPQPSQTNCDRPRFGQSIPIDKLSVNIINPYGNALPLPAKILKTSWRSLAIASRVFSPIATIHIAIAAKLL
ncbi:MAG: hypothetical protein ACK5L4_15725 [Pseudanabaena sp.]|nr:hypothetical protein [Pseudanabaena sp. M046S1SP1A06QC]